jgi:hypothetical protein
MLAAMVWYIGGIMLIRKAVLLLFEAESLSPQSVWPELAVGAGVAIGLIKARFIFKRACRRNLARIDSLERPVWWQFFSLRFFPFLALMIIAGATSSRLAHGHYPYLIGVAMLDITIGTALLSSSLVFWKERFLSKA